MVTIQMKDNTQEINNNKKIKKVIKNKCTICNKKQFIIHHCKCGGLFCLKHRLPEIHNCDYDFKNDHSNKLEQFESCVFKKIEKI